MSGRMIDAGIFEDDFFMQLGLVGRLLWIGLITCCADDQGRLQDNLMLIKSRLFPMGDCDMAELSTEFLEFIQEKKIIRYTVNGKHYIQIVNWWKYQRSRWAGKSRYPAPEGWTDRIRYHGEGNVIIEANWKSKGGFDCIADSIGDCKAVNTTRDGDGDGDVKGDEEGDGEVEKAPAAAAFSETAADARAETIFRAVTGWMMIPNSEQKPVIEAIRTVMTHHPGDAIQYLKPFYVAHQKRYPNSTRLFWLTDWAISGKIPKEAPGKRVDAVDPDSAASRRRYVTGQYADQIEH